MGMRALLLTGLLAAAPAAAHAQSSYGQGAYGQGDNGGYGYDQGDQGRNRAQSGSAYDRGYDDRSAAQGRRGFDGYGDDDRAPAPNPPSGRPPGGAGYADADQAPPDLGRDLGLRSDQQAALRAYQQATTPTEADRSRAEQDFQRLTGLTTPQRLDFTAAQMQRDQADFARRAVAVRRFYAQLTPEQQRRFDQLTAPPQGEEGDGGAASPR